MSTAFVNGIFFSQFGCWLILYTLWVTFLNEGRVIGLFFAILALCFLLSNANRIWSLTISLTVCVLHGGAVYWGITQLGQAGNMAAELFYVFCFLPSAVLISNLAGQFQNQKNEIKNAKRSAEHSRDSLQDMIRYIAEKCKALALASEGLLTLSSSMNANADEIAQKTEKAAVASGDISQKTNVVATAIHDASNTVSRIAKSTEDITATIQEISKTSEKAKEISTQAVLQSQAISKKVKQLGDGAQAIGKITEVISEISEQTNLLALNATIEAARAGESGRGFAVVANEIKELAKQTAEAAAQIKQQIAGLQASTVQSANEIIENISIITKFDEIVSTITQAIEEQFRNTRDIAQNVTQSSRGMDEVKKNAANTSAVVEEIANAIHEVSRDVGAIADNSAQVNQSAESLRQLAKDLKDMTDDYYESKPPPLAVVGCGGGGPTPLAKRFYR